MDAFIESLTRIFIEWGYGGLFLSAFIAGSIVPFSSELILFALVRMGLDPIGCLIAASTGNTLGGMTCFWIGRSGKREWITKYLRIGEPQLEKATRFLAGRGAWCGFFAFLPYIGEAIAIVLGLMRSNAWIACTAMFVGKMIRYIVILYTLQGTWSLL